jgi:uncharacterized protein (TIGR03086 family)
MSVREQLLPAVTSVRSVVQNVPADRMDARTPCEAWTVRELANHLLGTSEAMRRVGAGEELDPDDPWGTGGDHLHEGWRDELSSRLVDLAAAWDAPDSFEGEAMGGQLPKQMVGAMAFVEVVLHGWDLARGSSQEVSYDDGVVAAALEVMDQIGGMGRSQGAFGALVEVPADAPGLDRVLAQAGRDPRWTA